MCIIPLIDTRCDAAWQAANPQQFQELVALMVAESMVGAGGPGREVGACRQLKAHMGNDTYYNLPNLQMPVFICGGYCDGIAPAANLEAIHKQVPNA